MNELKINGVYKHFKGDYYLVCDVAIHSEDRNEYVIYRALYGDNSLYIRPKDMFLSKLTMRNIPMLNKSIVLNYKI